MSYALVQEKTASTYGLGGNPTSVSVTLDAPPVAGRLLLARVLWSPEGAAPVVTDTAGNTWHAAHAPVSESAIEQDASVQVWYAYACLTATPFTVTADFGDPQLVLRIAVSEWSGRASATDPLGDTDTTAIPPSASLPAPYDYTAGTVSPSAAGDLVFTSMMTWELDANPPDATALADVDGVFPGFYTLAASAAAYAAAISFTADPGVFLGSVVVFRLADDVWVDIPNWHAHEYLDSSSYPGGVARCVCKLWTRDAGVMVKARLVSLLSDGTVDAVVGTSAEVTSQTPVDATFSVTLAGYKAHKLQLASDTPGVDLFCAPDAKVVA